MLAGVFLSGSASASKPLTKGEYNQLFMATFSYMTVVKACGLSNLYQPSDEAVVTVIRYGYKHSLHNTETERISQNVSLYTLQGIEGYRKTAKITCAQAADAMRTIIKSAQQFK